MPTHELTAEDIGVISVETQRRLNLGCDARFGLAILKQAREHDFAWTALLLDSFRGDLRLAGRFMDADVVRKVMESLHIFVSDLDLATLAEYREGYRQHCNKPNATLVDLEMF